MFFALHCHTSIGNMENNPNPEMYLLEPYFHSGYLKF